MGERENGRARGRHARGEGATSSLACLLLARPFFLELTTIESARGITNSNGYQQLNLRSYYHFHSFLILHYIYYISQRTNAENCFRITGLQLQEQTITRAILPRNQLPSVSNSQRGRSCEQIFDSSTTFLNPLVGTNSLYGKRTVGFFSLASHALRVCEARALRARNTHTPRFTDFFTDFEKKTDRFSV